MALHLPTGPLKLTLGWSQYCEGVVALHLPTEPLKLTLGWSGYCEGVVA